MEFLEHIEIALSQETRGMGLVVYLCLASADLPAGVVVADASFLLLQWQHPWAAACLGKKHSDDSHYSEEPRRLALERELELKLGELASAMLVVFLLSGRA